MTNEEYESYANENLARADWEDAQLRAEEQDERFRLRWYAIGAGILAEMFMAAAAREAPPSRLPMAHVAPATTTKERKVA